jgi:hypothetical protein
MFGISQMVSGITSQSHAAGIRTVGTMTIVAVTLGVALGVTKVALTLVVALGVTKVALTLKVALGVTKVALTLGVALGVMGRNIIAGSDLVRILLLLLFDLVDLGANKVTGGVETKPHRNAARPLFTRTASSSIRQTDSRANLSRTVGASCLGRSRAKSAPNSTRNLSFKGT